jgi:nicotinate-nucleotide adenylyltransferase
MEETAGDAIPAEGPVGLFGGSFDPPHNGHLLMARDALERAGLAHVFFVPAAQSPLKGARSAADAGHREAMVRAAVEQADGFSVLDWELRAGGTSYTFATVRHFRELFPRCEPRLILGADQFLQLDRWRNIGELAAAAGFIVLQRAGAEGPPPALPGSARVTRLSARRIDISSSEVRERCRRGLGLEGFVPEAVARYIRTNGLYRGTG